MKAVLEMMNPSYDQLDKLSSDERNQLHSILQMAKLVVYTLIIAPFRGCPPYFLQLIVTVIIIKRYLHVQSENTMVYRICALRATVIVLLTAGGDLYSV